MTIEYEQLVTGIRSARNGSEQHSLVTVTRKGAHATVMLDDPEKLNPLGPELTVQLHDHLLALSIDPEIRAIVITGRDPAFSAGGDLRMMRDVAHRMLDEAPGGGTEIWRWIRNQFGGIARLITRTDKVFIAAVNGPAAGVGLAFALACDVLLLSERARIVPAFGRIGLLPEVGSSWQLTRLLGYQRAFALYASGRELGGADAFELGIGNELLAHEDLLPAAIEWCERIERLPAHVPAMTKPLLRQCADLTWEQAITMEEFAEPTTFTTTAHREAVAGLLAHAR
jgi:2-(1,2-epoxy-1,2-dihydrophenyl)acetyl-CoA isomerase